jgi:hypothetical protein
MSLTVSCKWLIPKDMIALQRTENPVLGKFLAETTARYMGPYVPRDNGDLYSTYTTEPFKIHYLMPYAHYQWRGISKKGRPLHYNKEKHMKARSQWHKAVEVERGAQIVSEVQEFVKRL